MKKRIGAKNTRWKGSEIRYAAAHLRIRSAHGAASAHQCVDCGFPAQEWSLDPNSPESLRVESGGKTDGIRYSTDPNDYKPRCSKCHRKYDKEQESCKETAV